MKLKRDINFGERRGHHVRLTDQDIAELIEHAKTHSRVTTGAAFGVSKSTVQAILAGKYALRAVDSGGNT